MVDSVGTTTWSYDALNRVTSVTDSFGKTVSYSYDPVGNRAELTYPNGETVSYAYDSANRLTAVNGPSSTVSYQYDDANRLTSVDSVAYTWDANGNLLSDGANTYTYDSANRLISIVNPQSSIENRYNGLGDRLAQNNVHYTLDLNAGLTQVLDDGTSTYLYGNGRISQTGTSTEYFLSDALGSVRQLTNEAAEITLTKAYEPYGEEAWSYGEGQSDYGFAAEWTDVNGLIHLRARYYAPYLNQFIQPDPWEGDPNLPATLNPFAYALNNPGRYTDPSGMIPQLLAAMGLGFVAGVAIGTTVGLVDRGWALSGECGCDIQQAALSMEAWQWVGMHALIGGIIGGAAPLLALAAAAAPIGAIVVGGLGVVLGGVDLYNTLKIIQNETGLTWCTGIRAALDIVSIVFGGALAWKGIQAWRASGSLLKWLPPTQGGLVPPTGTQVAPRAPTSWQDAERLLGQALGIARNNRVFRYPGMTRGRIPDYVATNFIADSKWYNSSSISLSSQLNDFLIISQVQGKPLWLYVPRNTTVFQTVIQALQATGGGIVRFFP